MIRNLKGITVALAVAVAGGAVAAPSAQTDEIVNFTAGEYLATLTGTSNESAEVFHMFGKTITCKHSEFKAELVSGPSPELEVTPKSTECTGFGAGPTTLNNTGCKYIYTIGKTVAKDTYEASSHFKCKNPKEEAHMEVFANPVAHAKKEPLCKFTFPEKTTNGLHIDVVTLEPTEISLPSVTEQITVTQTRNSELCPEDTHTTEAKYTRVKKIQLKATNKSGEPISVDVG